MSDEDHTLDVDEETLEQMRKWAADAQLSAAGRTEAGEGTVTIDDESLDELMRFAEEASRSVRPSPDGEGISASADVESDERSPGQWLNSLPIPSQPAPPLPDLDPVEVTASKPRVGNRPSVAPAEFKGVRSQPLQRPVSAKRSDEPWRPPVRIVVPKSPKSGVTDDRRADQTPLLIGLTSLCLALLALLAYFLVFGNDSETVVDPLEAPTDQDGGGGL